VCVCVCVRARERKRARECVCETEREGDTFKRVDVCVRESTEGERYVYTEIHTCTEREDTQKDKEGKRERER